jgi:hypothetical protein
MKLNVGCGTYLLKDYINIDNLYDYDGDIEEFKEALIMDDEDINNYNIIIADAYDLNIFKDNSIDEIISYRFIGRNVVGLKEYYKKLKAGGELKIYCAGIRPIFLKDLIFSFKKIEIKAGTFDDSPDVEDSDIHIFCVKE